MKIILRFIVCFCSKTVCAMCGFVALGILESQAWSGSMVKGIKGHLLAPQNLLQNVFLVF